MESIPVDCEVDDWVLPGPPGPVGVGVGAPMRLVGTTTGTPACLHRS